MVTAQELAPHAPVVTPDQLDLIKRTIAQGATDAELRLYLYDCARRGVHPLDRLILFSKRNGRYVPLTSIDYLRATAHATGEVAGIDDAVFRFEDRDLPSQATVTVYRFTKGERFAYVATARYHEYKADPGPSGKGDVMWRTKPFLMLAKCAEALALRKAFPQQLSGLYVGEELAAAALDESVTVDTTTGEELPRSTAPATVPPSGYRYIDALHDEGDWTHIVFYDADKARVVGRYRTKLAKVIKALKLAYTQGLPVAVDVTETSRGEGYVNAVEIFRPTPDLAIAEERRDPHDDPPA